MMRRSPCYRQRCPVLDTGPRATTSVRRITLASPQSSPNAPPLDSSSHNTVHSFTTRTTASEPPMPTSPIPASARTGMYPTHPRHTPRTEKTTPKLSQIYPPDRTISSKTLGIVRFSRPEKILSAQPNAATERPRPDSPACGPIRKQSNRIEQTDLDGAERGWTRLNDPDRSEHAIPRKTLGIVPFPRARKNSAEHRTTEPSGKPGTA